MKNLFTKIALVMLFVVSALLYFTNQSRITNKTTKLEYKQELDSIKPAMALLDFKYQALLKSKTKSDTVTVDISEHTKKIYEAKIVQAGQKPPTIVYVSDTMQSTRTLFDSLRTTDLTLSWLIKYSGTIYSIDFDHHVKQKIVTNNTVTEVPVPYEVIKYATKNSWYVGYNYGANLSDLTKHTNDARVGRLFKNGIGLEVGAMTFESRTYIKGGAMFRF